MRMRVMPDGKYWVELTEWDDWDNDDGVYVLIEEKPGEGKIIIWDIDIDPDVVFAVIGAPRSVINKVQKEYGGKEPEVVAELKNVGRVFPNVEVLWIAKNVAICNISNKMFPNANSVLSNSPWFIEGHGLISHGPDGNVLLNAFRQGEKQSQNNVCLKGVGQLPRT